MFIIASFISLSPKGVSLMCWSCYLTSMPSFIAHLKFCNCELVHKYIVGLVIAIKKGINIQNFTHLQNADAS